MKKFNQFFSAAAVLNSKQVKTFPVQKLLQPLLLLLLLLLLLMLLLVNQINQSLDFLQIISCQSKKKRGLMPTNERVT